MEKQQTESKFNKLNLLLIAIVVISVIVILFTVNPQGQTSVSTPTPILGKEKTQRTVLIINHKNTDPSAISQEDLDKARQLKVLFNHQSVGGNILEGLDNLASQDAARYSLTRWSSPQPAWYDTHSGVGDFSKGNNGSPVSKVEGFNSLIRNNGYRSHVQVAMMKFCYVDFGEVQIAWKSYSTVMQSLIRDFPEVKFVWWTVPITTDDGANEQRAAFNQLVRQYIAENGGTLFDIASIESHDPSDNAVTNGGVEAMYGGYSSDGGHLNQTGSVRVASAWWQLMSHLANATPNT
jgi:hypothetical protein